MKRRYVVGSAMTTVMLMIGVFFFAGSASMQGPETPDAVQAGTEVGADAPAAPSNTLFSYQGQLLNAAGSPITQTAVPITFRLYQVASAGTPCWIEIALLTCRTACSMSSWAKSPAQLVVPGW